MDIKPAYVTFEQWKHLNRLKYKVVEKVPEQWMVIEWLRVKYDIFISVMPIQKETFRFDIYTDKVVKVERIKEAIAKTPQESYSSAFDYIFENKLI